MDKLRILVDNDEDKWCSNNCPHHQSSEAPLYDQSIYSNPSAEAWAKEFTRIFPPGSPSPSEGTMLGWFANAMMAMYDSEISKRAILVGDVQRVAARWIGSKLLPIFLAELEAERT